MATFPTKAIHPEDDISSSYAVFIGLTAMFTVISTTCVVLRMYTRKLNNTFGWDDWTILVSLAFAYGFLVTTVLVATVADAGYHITEYTLPQLESYLKIALANNCLYNVSITFSKISVLLLYHRIFAVRSFHVMIWVVMSIVIAEFIVAECGLIFASNPVQAQWQPWLPHTSIDDPKFWLATAIINILLDVIILVMPQTRVWRLQMSTQRKILLSLVFLLGGFVTVATIVRIAELETVNIADLTYTLTTPGIWTMIEMNFSIICASLPTLPVLFRYWYDGTRPDGSKDSGRSGSRLLAWLRSKRRSDGAAQDYLDLESPQLSSNPSSHRAVAFHDDKSLPSNASHELHSVQIRHDIDVYRS